MMAASWTDEQLALTIWAVFTFGPVVIINLSVRWLRWLNISAVAAARVRVADEGIRLDRLETVDDYDTCVRSSPSGTVRGSSQGEQT